jgi:hypothetical protein
MTQIDSRQNRIKNKKGTLSNFKIQTAIGLIEQFTRLGLDQIEDILKALPDKNLILKRSQILPTIFLSQFCS